MLKKEINLFLKDLFSFLEAFIITARNTSSFLSECGIFICQNSEKKVLSLSSLSENKNSYCDLFKLNDDEQKKF